MSCNNSCNVQVLHVLVILLFSLLASILIYLYLTTRGPYFAGEVFGPHVRSRGPISSEGVQILHTPAEVFVPGGPYTSKYLFRGGPNLS